VSDREESQTEEKRKEGKVLIACRIRKEKLFRKRVCVKKETLKRKKVQ